MLVFNRLFFGTALAALLLAGATSVHAEVTLKTHQDQPAGFSAAIAAQISSDGFQVLADGKPLCDIHLAKTLSAKSDFKPTLNVKYPFQPGQFMGVLVVPEGVTFHDFRGQEISSGSYTLRYAHQPVDGNHIGTSDVYDFLLMLPTNTDESPEPIEAFEDLAARSAQSAGSNHPAILLMPGSGGKKAPAAGAIVHDEGHDFWIFTKSAAGMADGKKIQVPFQVIVQGRALE